MERIKKRDGGVGYVGSGYVHYLDFMLIYGCIHMSELNKLNTLIKVLTCSLLHVS